METKHRILVVDDSPGAAELARTWFEREGHACRTTRTAKDALVIARGYQTDIVLVDIGLPDSLELARRIRGELPAIYIAAMTGRMPPETIDRAFGAGCDHYLVKPANENKLRFMLWHAESRRTGRSARLDDARPHHQ